ncbi:polysaccharide deacetylase family protein [uncultured Paludibaculum sp.]|uniref:polysaccharide deacetylase family protein n=1 Tax=uncultured Paludibaculum sp. TaxID=1765020 RepID=UPI002AAC3B5C|nr:polysaccharide deacetylase family protein [uncultured Paludibaculum sp.]
MILFLIVLLCLPLSAQDAPKRSVAFTFDDLPNGGARMPLDQLTAMTAKLLDSIKQAHMPAIGFVNEEKLDIDGERDQRIALLNRWLDAGCPLGNHTYSHPDLNKVPLLTYQEDILKGEHVISGLMKDHGLTLNWFRYPFTHTGNTGQSRDSIEGFLQRKGYRIAPFTVETSDYLFAQLYRNALDKGDQDMAKRIRTAYVDYTQQMFTWFERLSQDTLGYELPQILLIHANRLNADAVPDLAAMLRRRGYTFVSLDAAMKDEAYRRRDGYVGDNGPSYLHRWAITAGKPNRLREEPDPPSWIVDMFREQTK